MLHSQETATLERASSENTNPSSLMLAIIVAGMAIRKRTAGKREAEKLEKLRRDGSCMGRNPRMRNQSLAGRMQMHRSQIRIGT